MLDNHPGRSGDTAGLNPDMGTNPTPGSINSGHTARPATVPYHHAAGAGNRAVEHDLAHPHRDGGKVDAGTRWRGALAQAEETPASAPYSLSNPFSKSRPALTKVECACSPETGSDEPSGRKPNAGWPGKLKRPLPLPMSMTTCPGGYALPSCVTRPKGACPSGIADGQVHHGRSHALPIALRAGNRPSRVPDRTSRHNGYTA